MIEVNIKLYDIEKCGYYKNRVKEPVFGNTQETIEEVVEWIKNKKIIQNSTFDPAPDSSQLKAYFFNVLKSKTNDYYFSIWNEVPSTEQNSVAAISGSANIGKADMKFSDFGTDYIPGFATYFWVSPLANRLATIRFKRSYNGHQAFKLLMQGFLNINPKYASIKKDINNGIVTITGYDINNANDEKELCKPRFQTTSMRKGGPVDFIRRNIKKVSKIYGRTLIVHNSKKSLSIYNRFLGLYGISNKSKSSNEDFKIEYEIPCTLTSSDFTEIYEKWTQDESELEDVGFRINNELVWLSHEIQKTEMLLDIPMVNQELYNLDSIMKQIEMHKDKILYECSK